MLDASICSANNEQQMAIEQISSGLSSLEQTVVSSSTSTEEMNNLATEMQAQVAEMRRLISRFTRADQNQALLL